MADAPIQPLPGADQDAVTTAQTPDTAPDPNAGPPAGPLPPDLLKIHVLQALMAGDPPAVSASLKTFDKRGEADTIRKHKDILKKAGFGFYKSLSGQTGVLFNALYIHPDDLRAADKAGKLQVLAPPFDVVDHAVAKSGMHNPVLKVRQVPNGPAAAAQVAPPQASAQLPPGQAPQPIAQPQAGSASVNRKLMQARLTGMAPGAPTSGPVPGQGRFLNQVLKPVV